MTRINVAGLKILTRGCATTKSTTYVSAYLAEDDSIDEPTVYHAKDFGLHVTDLEYLCKRSKSIRKSIPRRLTNQSLQLDESVPRHELARKERILQLTHEKNKGADEDGILQLEGGHFADGFLRAETLGDGFGVHLLGREVVRSALESEAQVELRGPCG
jgi:hypothetical protein